MKICLAQLNPIVGDLEGNLKKLMATVRENPAADLLVFPELFLTGYPPHDLLRRRDFLKAIKQAFLRVLEFSRGFEKQALLLGLPWEEEGLVFNASALIKKGSLLGLYQKQKLTRFSLFDENQYFSPGGPSEPIPLQGEMLGIALGQELDERLSLRLKKEGATLIINPLALPFQSGRADLYWQQARQGAITAGLPLLQAHQVGANDELIFAGGSLALNANGDFLGYQPPWRSGVLTVDLNSASKIQLPTADEAAQIVDALVLGLRDYVRKSGMQRVIIGLSGGLDSAVVAVIAAKALGPENVWGVTMPGPFSPPSSAADATKLAQNLGIKFQVLPITHLYEAYLKTLAPEFDGTQMNVAEENIQARIRGNLLMALSNKFGGLVLTNSNKSELAVGYCTLYGDMSGGLAVIGDLYKTMVYEIAYYLNKEGEVIPQNTISKPPSAELRPLQRDDESLPPYETLDAVIRAYVDENLSAERIIERGFPRETVHWALKTIDGNDYKRRQAATILRVTSPVCGPGRRMPLAAKKGHRIQLEK